MTQMPRFHAQTAELQARTVITAIVVQDHLTRQIPFPNYVPRTEMTLI